MILELLRWTGKRSPAARTELGCTLSIKVVVSSVIISNHCSATCGSRFGLSFFHLHPRQLLRDVSFITRTLCGFKKMPKFTAASLQLGKLIFQLIKLERSVDSLLGTVCVLVSSICTIFEIILSCLSEMMLRVYVFCTLLTEAPCQTSGPGLPLQTV